jgi:hypothetical protein
MWKMAQNDVNSKPSAKLGIIVDSAAYHNV